MESRVPKRLRTAFLLATVRSRLRRRTRTVDYSNNIARAPYGTVL